MKLHQSLGLRLNFPLPRSVAAEAALERLPKPVGPGSFRVGLLDQLYLLRGEDIASRAKFGVYATRSD